MLGYKPNHEIWKHVNQAILNENAAEVTVTLISGLCALLVAAKVAESEMDARALLAAMLVSPDTGPAGSLLPEMQAELARLRAEGDRWIA